MIVSALAWLSAALLTITPKRRSAPALLAVLTSTMVFVVVSLFVIFDPAAEYTYGKDRSVYEDSFWQAKSTTATSQFEIGYSTLEAAFAFATGSPGWLFVFCAVLFLIAIYDLLSSKYSISAQIQCVFLTINFFPFFSGALNVSRQFVAASVLLLSYRYFSNALAEKGSKWWGGLVVFGFCAFASTFHRSALFIALPAAACILGLSYRSLAAISIALFLLSVFGVSEQLLGPLLVTDERMSQIVWSYSRGEVGLLYAGGVNRLDFLAFTLLPVLAHEFGRYSAKRGAPRDDRLVTFYCCLAFPFFVTPFVPFSDRLALYAWLIWPVVLCDQFIDRHDDAGRPFTFGVVVIIGTIATWQLFGLTATELVASHLP